jgi:hypothetical protein
VKARLMALAANVALVAAALSPFWGRTWSDGN